MSVWFFLCLQFLDHLLTGIEDICGHYGHHHWKDKYVLNAVCAVDFFFPMMHQRRHRQQLASKLETLKVEAILDVRGLDKLLFA